MILCLDVGNSQIYGGIFDNDKIRLRFRRTSQINSSSDEYGLFLRTVLRENNIDPSLITHISLCSVVPEVVHSLKNACKKYFNLNPFVLQSGTKTGLKIKYRNPLEVGSDRIANAIAGTQLYPQTNLIIIDFGTATTFCAISKDKEYLGGVIHAGLKISIQSLVSNTSKLPAVEIIKPKNALGRSTVEGIQSGLYYGHLGLIKEVTSSMIRETFNNEKTMIVGTGGFASLFKSENVFNQEVPDLVLSGLYQALKMNT